VTKQKDRYTATVTKPLDTSFHYIAHTYAFSHLQALRNLLVRFHYPDYFVTDVTNTCTHEVMEKGRED